jgi:peptidoglycan/LPS O-acetylase OafA/YrhL
MVFFVLSGFFISGSVFHRFQTGQWSWPRYLVDRLTRLWLVLLPALLLGACWDIAGIHFAASRWVYSGFSPNVPVASSISFRYLLGNVCFLAERFVPAFGSNGPLWSLTNEAWYYVMFPLMVIPLVRRGQGRWWALIMLIALGATVGARVSLYGIVWLLGACIHFIPSPPCWTRGIRIVVGFFATSGLLLGMTVANLAPSRFGTDALVGVAATVLIWAIVRLRFLDDLKLWQPAPLRKISKELAGCSYSLYLAHMPFLTFAKNLIARGALPNWHIDGVHIAYALAIGCLCLVYALMIAHATEWHTAIVRDFVRCRLGCEA